MEEAEVLKRFVENNLLKKADQDYIAARSLFNLKQYENYIYHIAQAIEKYFKSILLLESLSVKSLNHNINRAYKGVKQVTRIEEMYTTRDIELLNQLSEMQYNRYGESEIIFNIDIAIPEYDCLIWKTRYFCKRKNELENEIKITKMAESHKISIDELFQKYPKIYHIQNGYLEKVLERSNTDSEFKNLVSWNNYYGPTNSMTLFKDSENQYVSNNEYLYNDEEMNILSKYVKIKAIQK